MRIVFLNQYYPPDAAPTGVMLESVAGQLAAAGNEVTVICADGGYSGAEGAEAANPKQAVAGVQVLRIGATRFGRGTFVGKLLDYFSYYLGVAWRLLVMHPRPDRIVALTTPPYLSVLARAISKLRGGDHAHWVMDLYPDVMAAHGMLPERSPLYRVLLRLARWGFGGRRCAAVLALGPDMAERIDRLRNSGSGMAQWVPLWASTEAEGSARQASALRAERGWTRDDLLVMYSGNMGLGHCFGEILEAARSFSETPRNSDPRPRFAFFGRGKRRAEVEQFIAKNPDSRTELHDYASSKLLLAHLQSADVHLVSLDTSWTGTMVPSKLQGIFTIGRPVIFIGSRDSSIGRWVAASGAGWCVEQNDVPALLAALEEAGDPAECSRRGRLATEFARSHFDRMINAARVAEIFSTRS